jgi:hypothetical protein
MTQTLNVEYDELMARANEIEQPLPAPPTVNPNAPCTLSFVNDAATQLALSADSVRLYLKACEREWKTLAQSLRNAAKAYENVDEEAAVAINNVSSNASGAAVTPASVGGNDFMINCDPDEDWTPPRPPPPPPPFVYPYYEVRQAVKDIEAPDQGTGCAAFTRDWDAYQRALQTTTVRFRPFTSWEGEARLLVEQNFELQRRWIYSMATLCSTLASQAKILVETHKWARAEHPSPYEISQCDYWYKAYTQTQSPHLPEAHAWYTNLQTKSEQVLSDYVRRASLPLTPVKGENPPTSTVIKPPPKKPADGEDGGNDPNIPNIPNIPDIPNIPNKPNNPTDGLPSGGGDFPDPTGMPGTGLGSIDTPEIPSMPDNSGLAAALKDLKGSPDGLPKTAGVKPASFGGGGAGMPSTPLQSMPLQPSLDPEAASRPAAAAPGSGALGRGIPGAGGAMGGGGMPLMAPGAQGKGQQGNSKGKRAQEDDEALYTEERPWSEGIIGLRPKDAPGR